MQVPQEIEKERWTKRRILQYVNDDFVRQFRRDVMDGKDIIDLSGTGIYPDYPILQTWVEKHPALRSAWMESEDHRIDTQYPQVRFFLDAGIKMSADLEDEILTRFASGESLRKICGAKNMPSVAQVTRYFSLHAESFESFERAKKIRATVLADESMDIVDDVEEDRDHISKAKLRMTVRLQLAKFLDPDNYGDKVQVDTKITLVADELVAAQKRLEQSRLNRGVEIQGECKRVPD
jgi:hypothetical protein